MFESLLYQLLAGYLGHYIKDINREHFRLGLWNGEALLENVEVRLSAFDYLQLPFAIKQGFVGKLRFQVPWSKLGWEPILISLEDVRVTAGPHEESEYGAEASERRALAAKKAGLAAAEIARLSQRLSEDTSGKTFLSYISAKIIDNIQVTVKNVHIQYVDRKTDPKRCFSFGVTLSSLTIKTTDGRDYPVLPGKPAAAKGTVSPVYKLVEAKRLAVYWNSEGTQESTTKSFNGNDRSSVTQSILGAEEDMLYLLRPTSATLRLTVDRKETPSGGGPHYFAVADIDDLSVALEDHHLVQMLLLVDVFSMARLRERYARFRPQVSDSDRGGLGWPRRLWTFAIQAVLSDVRKHLRGSSWSYFSWRSERQKRYVSLYKEKLEALQRVEPAVDQNWTELEEMEREFEMDEILYFRTLAENQFQLRLDMLATAQSELEGNENESDASKVVEKQQGHPLGGQRGWLNWLSLGLLGAAKSIDAAVCPDEIIKDLCDAAAEFDPTVENEKGSSFKGQCRFILSVHFAKVCGSLVNSSTKSEILNLSVRGTSVTFSFWQEFSAVTCTVCAVEVFDVCTPATRFPRILGPKAVDLVRSSSTGAAHHYSADGWAGFTAVNSNSTDSSHQANLLARSRSIGQSSSEMMEPLLKAEVEIRSKAKDFEVVVNIMIQPLEFVYSPVVLDRAVAFFSHPVSLLTRHDLLISSSETLENIAGHTRAKAEFAFATRKRVGLHLDVQRPTFIFPYDDPDQRSMLMIWNWEQLLIVSAELQSTVSSSADMAVIRRLWKAFGSTRCYERFEVSLIGVEVTTASHFAVSGQQSIRSEDGRAQLLEPFNLRLAVCCLPSDPTRMTKFRMSGEISSLRLHLSSQKCSAVKIILARILESQTQLKTSNSALNFGHYHASADQRHNRMPAVLEINLDLAVFTLHLIFDQMTNSTVPSTTLDVQIQDWSVRFTRWYSKEELEMLMGRLHVEDGNELQGIDRRHLLFDSDIASRTPIGTSSSPNKASLALNLRTNRLNVNRVTVDLSITGMECHCHPNVIRAIFGFIRAVNDTSAVNAESVSLDDGLEALNPKPTVRSKLATQGLNDPSIVLDIKLKAIALHLHDCGGNIGTLHVPDANISIFLMESGVHDMKIEAVFREIRLKGPHWASKKNGGETFGNSSNGPAATLSITITKTRGWRGLSGLEYKVLEVDACIQNAQCVFVKDYFAVLVGYCMSSEWKLSNELVNPEHSEGSIPVIDADVTICIVKLEIFDSVILLPSSNGIDELMVLHIPNFLFSFTPSELSKMEADKSTTAWPYAAAEEAKTVQMKCQDLALLLRSYHQSLQSGGDDQERLIERMNGEITIIVPESADAVRTGTSAIPVKTEIGLSVLHLNLAGQATRVAVDLLKVHLMELASIPWKCKSFASSVTQAGIRDRSPFLHLKAPPTEDSTIRFTGSISELTVFIKSSRENLSNIGRLQADHLRIQCFIEQQVLRSLRIGLSSLNLLYGTKLRTLARLSAQDGCSEDIDSSDTLTPLLLYANDELQLALPSIKVWLHLSSWSRIITASALVAKSPKYADAVPPVSALHQHVSDELGTGQGEAELHLNKLRRGLLKNAGIEDEVPEEVSRKELKPNSSTTDSLDVEKRPIRVKVGIVNVAVILPDYTHDVKPPRDANKVEWKERLQYLWIESRNDVIENPAGIIADGILECESNSERQIMLLGLLKIDEIEASTDGNCTINACFMQTEAAIDDNTLGGQSFRMRFLQASDINIHGQINLQHPSLKNAAFSVHVDSIDAWCSYSILLFLNREVGLVIDCPTDLSVENCIEGKFIYSLHSTRHFVAVSPSRVWWKPRPADGHYMHKHIWRFVIYNVDLKDALKPRECALAATRINAGLGARLLGLIEGQPWLWMQWSCNAPIVEVLLGKVHIEVLWEGSDIQALVSSDLEVNYHNIQKVAWEPLVEPWTACCTYKRVHEPSSTTSNRPFSTKVELTSSAPLNVNVTEALVQAISRALEMWSELRKDRNSADASADPKIRDPGSAENSTMRRYAPYWLQNDTGVPIFYWLCGTSEKVENDDEAKTSSFASSSSFGSARSSWGSLRGDVVQPGCSVPLYVDEGPDEVIHRQSGGRSVDDLSAKKMFSMLFLHRMICVQLEGTARPSVPMSIDLVGSVSFEAVFSDSASGEGSSRSKQGSFQEIESARSGSFSATVIFEVSVQRYSKLVRLCSTVSLVNTTSMALELRFDIPFLISPKVMEPVLPGHVVALPVHLAETGRMRWRPVGDNHLWSELQLLPHLLQLAETRLGFHRPIVCYPVHPSNHAFRCCIGVENRPVPSAKVATAHKSKDGRDATGSAIGTDLTWPGPDDVKGCMFWYISIKAPLVVKNCLPCALAITVETSAGVVTNVCAPEGDSIFVYDVDTTQDLNLTFLATMYLPTCAKLANATSFSSETGRGSGQDLKVTVVQALHFIPEITTCASVSAEMELDVELVTGARELRISAPFWLYNCSYLNLAVMDGNVDLYSGRELYLEKGSFAYEEGAEEPMLHLPGSRFSPTGANGLQVSLDAPRNYSSDRIVKRPARISSQVDHATTLDGSVHLILDKTLPKRWSPSLEGERDIFSDQAENAHTVENESKMWMFSPMPGSDASEMHLRARVIVSRSNVLGKDWEEKLWSRPFLLDPPGGTTSVTIPQPGGNGAYLVAVTSAPALGSCTGKTKTVTFRPRFLLANVSKQILCYKQQGTDKFQRLERGKHCQLVWHDINREFLISTRIDEHGWDWSGGFSPDQLGDTQVKVRNHTTGEMRMLRVEVSSMLASTGGRQGVGSAGSSLGTSMILVSDDETGFMPYRVENFTLERLRFHQQKCEKMENMLQPYSSCSYAWDEPCKPRRLVIEVPGLGELGAFWLDEVKDYAPVHFSTASEKVDRRWLVNVRAEGSIRVLSVADGSVHIMKGLGADGNIWSSSGEQFQEARQSVETNPELPEEFAMTLAYVGVSVIDTYPQEVIYACVKDLKLRICQGQHQQILKFDISWLQVDNQLRYAVYPVMLSIGRPPPDLHGRPQVSGTHGNIGSAHRTSDEPLAVLSDDAALSISVAKWRNPSGSVDCFQYISMRLEPLRLELEERVVSCLLQFVERISWSTSSSELDMAGASDPEPWSVIFGSELYGCNLKSYASTPWKYNLVHISASDTVRFVKSVRRLEAYRCWASDVAVEPINWKSQKLFVFAKGRRKAYVETLHISPVVLNVSFSSAPWLSDQIGGAATRSLLWLTGTLLQRQVRALADVEGAPVKLRQLKLAHPFASWDVIRGMITRHYTRQLLQEVYKVLGSADVFGNPVGFIRTVASGVWEFVSAPTRSSAQSPTELVRGVAQGTQRLFTNTVFAFSNAATRMSRAARKGVSVLTMDTEHDHALSRLLQVEGSEDISVVNEFLEGLTGLLQAPIRGAERHGLPGMLSGVALGAVGVIARPVASILDVAGVTAQSIRNRSKPVQWHATRIRLPRHVNDYSPLLLYSWERAVGQAVLLEAEGGRFTYEVYFTCKPLTQEGTFLLLTKSKILRVTSAASSSSADAPSASTATVYGPKWKLDLEGAIDDILHIDQDGSEISVLLGPPTRALVRPQHQSWGSSKYTTRFTAFAHETFKLITKTAADEVLEILRLLEDQDRRAQSKLLLASSSSISCPDFLDFDNFP